MMKLYRSLQTRPSEYACSFFSNNFATNQTWANRDYANRWHAGDAHGGFSQTAAKISRMTFAMPAGVLRQNKHQRLAAFMVWLAEGRKPSGKHLRMNHSAKSAGTR